MTKVELRKALYRDSSVRTRCLTSMGLGIFQLLVIGHQSSGRLLLIFSHAVISWYTLITDDRSLMTDLEPSTSHCDKGMYSKLGAPTRRSGELKTKYLFEAARQVYFVATARRKVGQVVNEALIFLFRFCIKTKMKIKGEACDSQIKIIHTHLRLHTPLLGGQGEVSPRLASLRGGYDVAI